MYSSHSRILIVGGGELGYMTAIAAMELGRQSIVINPEADCPARHVSSATIITGSFNDPKVVRSFIGQIDGAIIETEHISPDILRALANRGIPTFPQPDVLEVMQDRWRQKEFLRASGLPVVPFAVAHSAEELRSGYRSLRSPIALVKACRGGYNGSSQFQMNGPDDAENAWQACGVRSCTVEAWMKFRAELCVMTVRDREGNITVYPPTLSSHCDGIMEWALMPAPLEHRLLREATELARATAEAWQIHGLLAVEMFVVDGQLYINECAARFHNGGHPTRIGCYTSQFAMGARLAAGMGSASAHLIQPTAMLNLLHGMYNYQGDPNPTTMTSDDVWYHKAPRPRRKMGHVARRGGTPFAAMVAAQHAYGKLFAVTPEASVEDYWIQYFRARGWTLT